MKIDLDNVTLVCVDGQDNMLDTFKSIKALEYSSHGIKFKENLLISFNDPDKLLHSDIEWIPLEKKFSWEEYNEFIVKKLNSYIETDFFILIQTDGFIINPSLWKEEFLHYDYIGASWNFEKYPYQLNKINPQIIQNKGIKNLNRVGNGGFTLRSKKLMNIVSKYSYEMGIPEDVFICQVLYDDLIKDGIKFPPVEIADVFSKDPLLDISSTFGFHGNKELIEQI